MTDSLNSGRPCADAPETSGQTDRTARRGLRSAPRTLPVALLTVHAILVVAAVGLSFWFMSLGGYAVLLLLASVPVLVVSGICCFEGTRGRGVAGIIGSGLGVALGLFCSALTASNGMGFEIPFLVLLVYGGSLAGYVYIRRLSKAELEDAALRYQREQGGVPAGQSEYFGESGAVEAGDPDGAGAQALEDPGPQTEIERLLAATRRQLTGAGSRTSAAGPVKAPLGVWLMVAVSLLDLALMVPHLSGVMRMEPLNVFHFVTSLVLPILLLCFTYSRSYYPVLGLLAVKAFRSIYFLVSIVLQIWPWIMEGGSMRIVMILVRSAFFTVATVVFLVYIARSRSAASYFGVSRRK